MNDSSRSRNVFLVAVILLTATTFGLFGGCRGDFSGGGSGSDLLDTGRALSSFTAIQVDPRSEDSAGPQFVVAEDLNDDGLMDLITAWNQTQPVQIHLQGRTSSGGMSFETVTLAGNIPVVAVAGLAVEDFDQDGRKDIAVLIKETLLCTANCLGTEMVACGDVLNGVILMYLAPDDPERMNQSLAWRNQVVKSSYLAGGRGEAFGPPEAGGYTSMAVGDVDLDDDMDIVVAWNSACLDPPEILVFYNGGPGSVRNGIWPVQPIADPFQCSDAARLCAAIKDVALGDIDRDGDLDMVVTFPDAESLNLRWYRNPLLTAEDAEWRCYHHDGSWNVGTIGQVPGRADIVRLGDIDQDGILDVVMRSSEARVIQWFKGPECPTTPMGPNLTDPFRHLPWQVYTMAEFTERIPEGLALGDINFDGQLDLIAAAGGAVAWFDGEAAPSVFDHWREHLIIDDVTPGASIGATDPSVETEDTAETTFINSIIVVDLNGDGANDLVVTLDRTTGSGITNDAIAWLRNDRRAP